MSSIVYPKFVGVAPEHFKATSGASKVSRKRSPKSSPHGKYFSPVVPTTIDNNGKQTLRFCVYPESLLVVVNRSIPSLCKEVDLSSKILPKVLVLESG